jgi:hypothetical protein
MINARQNPIDCTARNQNDWFLHSCDVEAELEKLDRQAGHEYVPMDLFVAPETRKEHFESSSVSARWSRIHHSSV